MKTKLFTLLAIVFAINFGKSQDTLKIQPPHKFIGFSPSKNIQNVNVLVKYFDEFDNDFRPKQVNGLGLGFNMIGIFFPPMMLVSLPTISNWDFFF